MKKILSLAISIMVLVLFIVNIISCGPGEPTVGGEYLKVSVTGYYYDENTGEMTTDKQSTLTTVVNLYGEGGRYSSSGYFSSREHGLVYGSQRITDIKADPRVFGGSAHLNGFIAKGPLAPDSRITVTLYSDTYEEIEIADTTFSEVFTGESDTTSSFSINLPSTEDVEIPVNMNTLSTVQSKRVDALMSESKNVRGTRAGMTFAEAYAKSKEEILKLFDLESDADVLADFENLSLIEDNQENSLLLLASSILLDDTDSTESTLLENFIADFSQYGEITDEGIFNKIKENMNSVDLQTIANNLQSYYETNFTGETFQAPGTGTGTDTDLGGFQDADGDGVVDMYDVEPVTPMGFFDFTGQPPAFPNFELIGLDITDATVQYVIQISTNAEFQVNYNPDAVHETNPFTPTDGVYTIQQADIDWFNNKADPGSTLYWRIAAIVDDDQKGWSSPVSFVLDTSGGTLSITGNPKIKGYWSDNAYSYPIFQKTIVIDSSGVTGATEMKISNNGNSMPTTWTSFQLYKEWTVTPDIDNTVYIHYTNDGGVTWSETTISYTYTQPTTKPTGEFFIVEDYDSDGVVYYQDITLDILADEMQSYGKGTITGAFKMRFVEGDADIEDAEWVDFAASYPWTLSIADGETTTITGQFKNSFGILERSITITYVMD